MKTVKVINFIDDDDDNDNDIDVKQQTQKQGFGFTKYPKHKLLKTSQRLLSNRKLLPVYQVENKLKHVIDNNDNIIIIGATGSGKTTQVAQFLYKWGYCKNKNKCIAITQPRRVAAISISQRVSQEFGTNVGDKIGYHVRFDKTISNNTQITYLTDGMLLRECIVDNLLKKYSIIILDEAHERTLNTDILFGLIKSIQAKRNKTKNKLKLIIMSATLQSEKFSQYFNNAIIYNVKGRKFNVDTLYLSKPETNYINATLTAILQIHLDAPPGDILVFLTGKDEIDSMQSMLKLKSSMLNDKKHLKLHILTLYSSLPPHIQQMVFKKTPHGFRKIVLSTNIAETSITIPNINYVIDCGKVKRRIFNPLTGIDIFEIQDISKEESWQRCGRAGRTSKGFCFRLYTEEFFEKSMPHYVKPDILRSNLCSTILQLKSIGIDDILSFDFMDKPTDSAIIDGIGKLMILGALDINTQKLTDFGRKMCIFPLDPVYSKIILSAHKYKDIKSGNNIVSDILMIVSMLSVDGIFYDGKNQRNNNKKSYLQFENEFGDHLTLLNVFKCFISNKCDGNWCKQNGLNSKSLKKANQIYQQLSDLYHTNCSDNINTVKANKNHMDDDDNDDNDDHHYYSNICKCLLDGLFMNIAYFDEKERKYKTYSNDCLVDIHPSSLLFDKKPKCILFSSMVKTKDIIWLKCVTEIVNDEWLDSKIPNLKLLSKITMKTVEIKENDANNDNDTNNNSDNKSKNRLSKPGRAVKRMHHVYENVKNGRFDFQSHRKKLEQKHQRGMSTMMMYANLNSLNQHKNILYGYRGNNNNRYKRKNNNNNHRNYRNKNSKGRQRHRFLI